MKMWITPHFGVFCSRSAIKQIGIWVWPRSPSTRKDPSRCVLTVVTGQYAGGREAALLRALVLLSTSNFRKPQRQSECSWTMRKALCLFTTQRPRPTFTLTPDVASLNPCIHTSTPVSMTTARTPPLWSSVLLRLQCQHFEKLLSPFFFSFKALTIVITKSHRIVHIPFRVQQCVTGAWRCGPSAWHSYLFIMICQTFIVLFCKPREHITYIRQVLAISNSYFL